MLLRCGGRLAAPHYSLVAAEWISYSEEVINLHIGDMSAGEERKEKNKQTES